METKDWFTSWFNTPYYHILYQDRNDEDARLFMRNITSFLQLPKNAHIADLPCGKGRHAVFLNSLGFRVTGGDLSENSIAFAKKSENESLSFEVWDMRKPLENRYDAIFNLFTSFGYFKEEADDLLVLRNMKNGLKPNGVLVLDFLNVIKLQQTLVKKETKTLDGITFDIQREIKEGFILKHISFTDKGKNYHFTERVKFLDIQTFKAYFKHTGLKLVHTFGNYNLDPYNEATSNRLICVAS